MLEYQLDQIKIVNFLLIDKFWLRELFFCTPSSIQLSGGRGVCCFYCCWEARKAGRSYDLTGFLAILINGPDDHFGRDLSSTRMHGARTTFVG